MALSGRAGHRVGETVDWASVEADLDIVRRTRANLLVIGSDSLVMDVIRWVIADAPATTVDASEWGRLALSHLWQTSGTLVLRDLDELDADGQLLLFDWLERAERQIVSTASSSLLPLVDAGVFHQGLYYRLNTVSIRLGQ